MKKTLWVAIAGALAATVVAASAQEVLSENAVGYIKRTIPAGGKFQTFGVPLNSMTEASNVFGRTSVAQEAPRGTTVYFWNLTPTPGWVQNTKGLSGWGSAYSNRTVLPGEGFMLKSATTSTLPIEVTITGEVPDTSPLNFGIAGGSNLNMVANAYPVDVIFGQTPLAINSARGSTVFFWDVTANGGAGGWVQNTRGLSGWGTAYSNRVVQAGEGFMLKETGTSRVWTNAKPYTWP